jgi:hypothetical protein
MDIHYHGHNKSISMVEHVQERNKKASHNAELLPAAARRPLSQLLVDMGVPLPMARRPKLMCELREMCLLLPDQDLVGPRCTHEDWLGMKMLMEQRGLGLTDWCESGMVLAGGQECHCGTEVPAVQQHGSRLPDLCVSGVVQAGGQACESVLDDQQHSHRLASVTDRISNTQERGLEGVLCQKEQHGLGGHEPDGPCSTSKVMLLPAHSRERYHFVGMLVEEAGGGDGGIPCLTQQHGSGTSTTYSTGAGVAQDGLQGGLQESLPRLEQYHHEISVEGSSREQGLVASSATSSWSTSGLLVTDCERTHGALRSQQMLLTGIQETLHSHTLVCEPDAVLGGAVGSGVLDLGPVNTVISIPGGINARRDARTSPADELRVDSTQTVVQGDALEDVADLRETPFSKGLQAACGLTKDKESMPAQRFSHRILDALDPDELHSCQQVAGACKYGWSKHQHILAAAHMQSPMRNHVRPYPFPL